MSAVEATLPDQPDQPAQDELKKEATTEDESSQDSKVDPIDTKTVTDNGDATIKEEPTNGEKEPEEEKPAATENGKIEEELELKEEPVDDVKLEKPEENGETHDSEDKAEEEVDAEKKPVVKKDDTEDDEEVEEEEEEGEDEGEGEEGEEKEDKEEKKEKVIAPKKPKKEKSGEDGEEEDEEEEEEEGEGEVEDEEEIEGEEGEEIPQPKKKKEPTEPPVPVPAGKGIPLGHIPNVEIALSRFKIEDLKFLHQFLYNQLCRTNLIKRNIKKFKGYEYEKDSAEYKEKVEETQKFEPKQLRMLCEMLDLDKRGSPNDLSTRIVGFCLLPKNQSPHARGAVKERPLPESTPGGRPRRSAAVKVARGYSDEEYESDPETKVKGPRAHRDESADSDGSYNPSGSGQDPDSDFDPAATEGTVTRKRRGPTRSSGKGRRGRPKGAKGRKSQTSGRRGRGRKPANSDSEDESESESGSEEESESEGEESDPLTSEPPSKRGRGAVTGRGRKPVAVKRKGAPAKKKPGPASMTKGRSAGKKRKASSSEDDSDEGSVEEEDGSEEEGSSEEGSEEEQEAASPAKKAKHPPTDEEIKKYVEQILEGANLEEITMKTVCKQVYSHYPDFDLAHKKDFIKATVKSLISS